MWMDIHDAHDGLVARGATAGMHWKGTTQCTRCCGISNLPVPRGQIPPPYGGKGLTNSYAMEVLDGNGWHYIVANRITFPQINKTGITQYVQTLRCAALR